MSDELQMRSFSRDTGDQEEISHDIRIWGGGVKVVLHAGMHKTGTTSFQNWLSKLEDVGVFVTPPFMNARNPRLFDSRLIAQRLGELERAGCERVIVSQEAISLLDPNQLRRLREALEAGGATSFSYVVAIRHWCGFLPSRWRQNCRRRDAQPFGRFLHDLRKDAARRVDAGFDIVLENAARAGFEDVRVISYEAAARSGDRGVIAALAAACGVPAPPEEAVERSLRANASSGDEEMDMLRLFNGVRSEMEGRPSDPLFAAVRPGRRRSISSMTRAGRGRADPGPLSGSRRGAPRPAAGTPGPPWSRARGFR